MRHYLAERGFAADRFGWASVQMDGGIAKVRAKVAGQLEAMAAARTPERGSEAEDAPGGATAPRRETVGAEEMRIALAANGPLPEAMGEISGGSRPASSRPARRWSCPTTRGFWRVQRSGRPSSRDRVVAPRASLAFGQPADEAGFHVMEAPTENPVETFTGLGATGAEIMLCHIGRTSLQAHPMIPSFR